MSFFRAVINALVDFSFERIFTQKFDFTPLFLNT